MTMDLLHTYEWLNFLSPMWVEMSVALFFLLGFVYMRLYEVRRRSRVRKVSGNTRSRLGDDSLTWPQSELYKSLEADLSAGQAEAALHRWRAGKKHAPTPAITLALVAKAFLEVDPKNLVSEIIEHLCTHKEMLCHTRAVTGVLDVIARSGHVGIMDEFAEQMRKLQGLTTLSYEVLVGGHATAGDERQVRALFDEVRKHSLKITPRTHAMAIKGFLKNGMVDAALQQIVDMREAGFFVPSFAVTQLFHIACEAGRIVEIFERTCPMVPISSDAFSRILDDALKRDDLNFALHVEKVAKEAGVPLLLAAYESLLKLCIAKADLHALQLFDEMQKRSLPISEGLCVVLLARCADSKFLCFAEDIARFVRGRDGLTIGFYSSLMKCYAYCGMYSKACDLYQQVRASGLEPDSMMYGCLMKFAVECGRTELAWELFDKTPTLDIQNYMSLIRAAGRDKDVARAFSLLYKLEASDVPLDLSAYSCVLDACVSAGDMVQAQSLVEQMKTRYGSLDIVTFNTLLKGYCSLGDSAGAQRIVKEMTSLGLPPNDVSFNCLINAAVSRGDFVEAWETVDLMQKSGVPLDQYTLSIIMKSLKRVKNVKYVHQAFDLVDRAGIDVCCDEILLSTLLEACIRHNQLHRMETVMDAFSASSLRPGVHTYGTLIKACSALKRLDRCWELWYVIVEQHGVAPNEIVLGCMLDALVCNNKVEDAVILLGKWKTVVPANTVMYSTIIKGFANSHQAPRAMAMWQEMRELGVPLNSVVYHSLIDSQARVGAMDQVSKLVEDMMSKGLELDVIAYSTIVKGYCVKGDLDKAFEVFRSMQEKSMAVNCIIYNTLLDWCTKHNRMDLADLVISDMEEYGIKPSNYTLGILVKMYGRRHQLDKAFEAVAKQIQKHGILPNLQAKTCLMCACVYNHDFERAYGVFEEVKSTGQGADAKVYGALISGIVRNGHGRLPEAVELVKEAYGFQAEAAHGHVVSPTPGVESEVLDKLFHALTTQGMMKSLGMPLLRQLRTAKVPISCRLFSRFLTDEK